MPRKPKFPAPDYLDERATEIYNHTFADLPPPVTFSEATMLGTYAQNLSDFERLTEIIREDGDMSTDKDSEPRKHPLGIPQAKAHDMYSKAAKALGIGGKSKAKATEKPKAKSKVASMRKSPRSRAI